MKLKYSLLAILLLTSLIGTAQSNVLSETRNWSSFENIDLYSGQTLQDTFLITINSTALTLTNAGMDKNFQIQNIQGSWSNINETGQLTFDLIIKDFTGKGTVQNEAGVISLVIDFSARKDWMKRKIIITN